MLFLTSPHPLTPCLAGRQASPEVGRGTGTPLLASPFQGGGLPVCRNDSTDREGGEMKFQLIIEVMTHPPIDIATFPLTLCTMHHAPRFFTIKNSQH